MSPDFIAKNTRQNATPAKTVRFKEPPKSRGRPRKPIQNQQTASIGPKRSAISPNSKRAQPLNTRLSLESSDQSRTRSRSEQHGYEYRRSSSPSSHNDDIVIGRKSRSRKRRGHHCSRHRSTSSSSESRSRSRARRRHHHHVRHHGRKHYRRRYTSSSDSSFSSDSPRQSRGRSNIRRSSSRYHQRDYSSSSSSSEYSKEVEAQRKKAAKRLKRSASNTGKLIIRFFSLIWFNSLLPNTCRELCSTTTEKTTHQQRQQLPIWSWKTCQTYATLQIGFK